MLVVLITCDMLHPGQWSVIISSQFSESLGNFLNLSSNDSLNIERQSKRPQTVASGEETR